MTIDKDVGERHLVVAAVLAGAAGLGLVVLGWWMVGWHYQDGWSRLSDSSWWAGALTRAVGFLLIGKLGFKIALALVFAAVTATAAVRRRRSRRAADAMDDTSDAG